MSLRTSIEDSDERLESADAIISCNEWQYFSCESVLLFKVRRFPALRSTKSWRGAQSIKNDLRDFSVILSMSIDDAGLGSSFCLHVADTVEIRELTMLASSGWKRGTASSTAEILF